MDPLSEDHSIDDGLPQSPSACGLPVVFDLSRRRCDSPVNRSPVGALHVARAPRWGGISSRGAEPTENSSTSYRNSLSTRQVQPDNAFSNTTVTLSYINRSHVNSTQDQVTPKVHSIPSQPGSLSQPSPLDSKGHKLGNSAGRDGEGFRLQTSNRHTNKLASQSDLPRMYSEAPPRVRVRDRQEEITQQVPDFNGKHELLGPNGAARPLHHSIEEGGHRFSQCGEAGQGSRVSNGGSWDMESCSGKYSLRGKRTSRKLYSSLNEDFLSALDEPSSPAESSTDEMEDLSSLPQTLNSPSSDSPCPEEDIANVAGVKVAEGEGCGFTGQYVEVSSSSEDSCSDDSDVIEVPVTNSLAFLHTALPRPFKKSLLDEGLPKNMQLTHTDKKMVQKVPEERVNGNTLVEERAVGRRKNPPHARLAVTVGNNASLGSKSPSLTQSVEQDAQPETLADHPAVLSEGDSVCGDSPSDSESELGHLTASESDSHGLCSSRQKIQRSTSGSEDGSFSHSHNCNTSSSGLSTPNKMESGRPHRAVPQRCLQKNTTKRAKKQPESPAKRSRVGREAAQKNSRSKKRKRHKRASQPSAFFPREPEIKLKYATYREEKRELRGVTFAPYVHLETKAFSSCIVINYLEEETGRLKKGQQRYVGQGLATGTVPTTSYLELGRLDAEGRRRTDQACCLCGGSANAMDLGDLHGPYRPREGQKGPRAPIEPACPKEEEACSDSDSSYNGQREKNGHVQEESGQSPRLPLGPKRNAALAAQCRWAHDDDSLPGPLAKTSWPVSDHNDQHSTPTEALHTRDFWLHEDCGVWTTGIFLVRGRLYGLEEAVRLAQGTVCSSCDELGATLGCFFRGCPNKYHYRCAMQSDCVLNEENFTMKCTKHKFCALAGVWCVCASAEVEHMSLPPMMLSRHSPRWL